MINEQDAAEKSYGNEPTVSGSALCSRSSDFSAFGKHERRPEIANPPSQHDRFALCRSHLSQLGLMMFENRQNIDLLNTSKTNCDQLLRELKNLDTLNCRETHKIGRNRQGTPR